ncbi:hypothetical protein D6D01_08195 [Aureobasidium pullulans]|uniref:Uncharacterized protein n=1 Tax=Aureobasidium pullulans TaxID=5580 RepID=A0A4V4JSL1_AURPU|nr:hypothetical protein D6D01_08195 [Aureobasidium pullulans]
MSRVIVYQEQGENTTAGSNQDMRQHWDVEQSEGPAGSHCDGGMIVQGDFMFLKRLERHDLDFCPEVIVGGNSWTEGSLQLGMPAAEVTDGRIPPPSTARHLSRKCTLASC